MDHHLLRYVISKDTPVILSTGMSTGKEIGDAACLFHDTLYIAHCTSTYPCPPEEANLAYMNELKELRDVIVGYSGHEADMLPTLGAVALGARFVERHITLDKTMWGSDQAASLESDQLKVLVKAIRDMELILGDGVKQVYDSEKPQMEKLRRMR